MTTTREFHQRTPRTAALVNRSAREDRPSTRRHNTTTAAADRACRGGRGPRRSGCSVRHRSAHHLMRLLDSPHSRQRRPPSSPITVYELSATINSIAHLPHRKSGRVGFSTLLHWRCKMSFLQRQYRGMMRHGEAPDSRCFRSESERRI